MIIVGVVGANGFVGNALCGALARVESVQLKTVTRETYADAKSRTYDILINAAMPAARFWAKNNPTADFVETVQKTSSLVQEWRYTKFVQISSVSARCQLDTVYGRHKAAAEKLCGFGRNLVVRLGPMYGPTLTKGVLIDMLEGKKVFVDGASRYCFAPLDFCANWVAANLDRSGLAEVGARNAISLREVAAHLGKPIEFQGAQDHQEIQNPDPTFPDVRDVLKFLDAKRIKP